MGEDEGAKGVLAMVKVYYRSVGVLVVGRPMLASLPDKSSWWPLASVCRLEVGEEEEGGGIDAYGFWLVENLWN